MDPITIGLIAGAGLGLLRGEEGKRKEKDQRLLNAEITRYSPWTRMNPEAVNPADPTGNVMQGAMTGAMMGQGISRTNAANAALAGQGAGAAAPQPMYVQGQGMAPYAQASPWTGMSPHYGTLYGY